MKTKYDSEIEKLERGIAKVENKLKNLRRERDAVAKPYDDEISQKRKALSEGYLELRTLKHKREVFIRNQELQENKDILKKGISFKDLVLAGDGRFSDYRYFLKSGTEVIPVLHVYAEEIKSEDEIRGKAEGILSSDELKHLSNVYWGQYLDFSLDATVESIRKLYQSGFKFRGFGSEEAVNFQETKETTMKRRQRSVRTTKYLLTYTRMPETVTVVKKGERKC